MTTSRDRPARRLRRPGRGRRRRRRATVFAAREGSNAGYGVPTTSSAGARRRARAGLDRRLRSLAESSSTRSGLRYGTTRYTPSTRSPPQRHTFACSIRRRPRRRRRRARSWSASAPDPGQPLLNGARAGIPDGHAPEQQRHRARAAEPVQEATRYSRSNTSCVISRRAARASAGSGRAPAPGRPPTGSTPTPTKNDVGASIGRPFASSPRLRRCISR